MEGFGSAVKYLYQNFILRDVLSFLTPGAMVVFTTVYAFSREMLSLHVPWPLYIPLFGIFFVVGFAIQCFGEIIGFVRIHLLAKSDFMQRMRIFGGNWDNINEIWWEEAYKKLAEFYEYTKDDTEHNERERRGHERVVILRQMCANNLLAIVVSGIFLLTGSYSYIAKSTIVQIPVIVIISLIILASLFWGYRVHVLREYTRDKTIVEYHKEGNPEAN